jgi:tetratricopeptide (TPR) repeat protein
VSLGRVLRDQKKDQEAVDALSYALQLDPGNVVAARLLADAYLSLGEKVEAIKKYKLVHALLPADQELEAMIATLDREINPPPPPEPESEPTVIPSRPSAALRTGSDGEESPAEEGGGSLAPLGMTQEEESPFDRTMPPFAEAGSAVGEEMRVEEATGDAEPMHRAHEESPFEEPVSEYTAAALEIEAPMGMHIESAPLAAEVPAPAEMPAEEEEADVFAPTDTTTEDVTNTLTMADLYARQGLTDDARHIYENLLARDPSNDDVRAKLQELSAPSAPVASEGTEAKVARLESWLSKVSKREVGSV